MFKANIRRRSAGFTLVEIVIAIAVVALLTVLVTVKGNSDDTRTTVLLSKMQEVSSGLLRMKSDVSCFPKTLEGLVTPQSENYCGTLSAADWKGNYIAESTSVNRTAHTIDLETIVPGTEMVFEKSIVGSTVRWMLFTKGLPADFAASIVKSCGGAEGARCGFDANRREAYVIVDESDNNTATAAPLSTSVAYSGPGAPASPASPPLVLGGGLPATPVVGPAPVSPPVSPYVPAVFNPAAPVAPSAPAPLPVALPSPTPSPTPIKLAGPYAPVTCPDGTTVPFGSTCQIVVIPMIPVPPVPQLPTAPVVQCTVGTVDCPRQSIWHFDLAGGKIHMEGLGYYNYATKTFSGLMTCDPTPAHAGFGCGTGNNHCGSDVACAVAHGSSNIDGWAGNAQIVADNMPGILNVSYILDYPYQLTYFDGITNSIQDWGVGLPFSSMPPVVYDPTVPLPPLAPIDGPQLDENGLWNWCVGHPERCIAP